MAWLALSLLGPREAKESRGTLGPETAASGTRPCGSGEGDQAGSWRGGEAGPVVTVAVYLGKEDYGDEVRFSRAWRSPSLRSGPPDSPRLLIRPRAGDPRGVGGMPRSPWGSVLPVGLHLLCSGPVGPTQSQRSLGGPPVCKQPFTKGKGRRLLSPTDQRRLELKGEARWV